MKILVNNYDTNSTESWICEHCNSVFEFEENDVLINTDGERVVRCPCCDRICYVNYPVITKDNIKFPKDFYQFGASNNAVEINDDEITSEIKKCISYLEEEPDEPYRYIAYGNMIVCVFNHEDEYYIMVAKNYFDCSIDK